MSLQSIKDIPLNSALRLSVVECKTARIGLDAAELESEARLLWELDQISPVTTPILDLRIAARNMRMGALMLDRVADRAEIIGLVNE